MVLAKMDYLIGKMLELTTAIFLAISVIITFVQVVFRYVLEQPLSWSQEALMISFLYSILFGSALAIKNREHLSVDLFENMSKELDRILKAVEFIVVGVVIVTLFYYGYELVRDNFRSGQIIGILPINKGYVYLAVPLSALFMFYYHVKKVFR
ncbi:TRAP transporter small permease [Thalassobacillus sp. CUG 92003]|uniref:TRAP transporter small permease n=1 Tax=Thalassobacillus sp. CUG 92003 TaxID=2736641 RepID=UPI00351A62C1